jgi:tyrosyl-tRNA synthetase
MTEHVFKSDFLRTCRRGAISIRSPIRPSWTRRPTSGIVTGYIGFDATAPSLHVGHLIQIMMLRRLQQAGTSPSS